MPTTSVLIIYIYIIYISVVFLGQFCRFPQDSSRIFAAGIPITWEARPITGLLICQFSFFKVRIARLWHRNDTSVSCFAGHGWPFKCGSLDPGFLQNFLKRAWCFDDFSEFLTTISIGNISIKSFILLICLSHGSGRWPDEGIQYFDHSSGNPTRLERGPLP